MRRAGLEWLYRLVRQPWRWRRMLSLPAFAWLVVRQALGKRRPSGGETSARPRTRGEYTFCANAGSIASSPIPIKLASIRFIANFTSLSSFSGKGCRSLLPERSEGCVTIKIVVPSSRPWNVGTRRLAYFSTENRHYYVRKTEIIVKI